MIHWLGLVVVGLASYRLTRIVTTDTLTDRARERLYRWAWVEPDEPDLYALRYREHNGDAPFPGEGVQPMPRNGGARTYVAELFNCPWCLGVWVSAGVYCAWGWWHWMPVRAAIVILAVAGLQGFLASRRDA